MLIQFTCYKMSSLNKTYNINTDFFLFLSIFHLTQLLFFLSLILYYSKGFTTVQTLTKVNTQNTHTRIIFSLPMILYSIMQCYEHTLFKVNLGQSHLNTVYSWNRISHNLRTTPNRVMKFKTKITKFVNILCT